MAIFQQSHKINYLLTYVFFRTLILLTLFIIFQILKFIYFLLYNLFAKQFNLSKRYGSKSWVLVTGSSYGCGKSYAIAFAKRGFNIILTARTRSKLEQVKQQILKINSQLQVRIIIADFKQGTKVEFYDSFMEEIKDLDISVLVNNVSVYELAGFNLLNQQKVRDFVHINMTVMSILSKKFIQRFRNRKDRSAIINVSSMLADFFIYGQGIYCSTKRFCDFLSRTLAQEYPQFDIISHRAGQMDTPSLNQKPNALEPQKAVNGLLKDLGKYRYSNGHVLHKVADFVIHLFLGRIQKFWKERGYNEQIERIKKVKQQQKKRLNKTNV